MAIDILEARQQIESLVSGLSSGVGVSMGSNEIIIYISDSNKEQDIRNRIGDNYQGFGIKYIVSGKVQGLSFQ